MKRLLKHFWENKAMSHISRAPTLAALTRPDAKILSQLSTTIPSVTTVKLFFDQLSQGTSFYLKEYPTKVETVTMIKPQIIAQALF